MHQPHRGVETKCCRSRARFKSRGDIVKARSTPAASSFECRFGHKKEIEREGAHEKSRDEGNEESGSRGSATHDADAAGERQLDGPNQYSKMYGSEREYAVRLNDSLKAARIDELRYARPCPHG